MTPRVTRAGFLWAGAAAAGGATVALRGGDGASHAAASKSSDREILAFFLTLEQVQEAFYRQAVEAGALDGELLELASRVGAQERQHAAFLTQRLGGTAPPRPASDFGDAFDSPERFRETAVELEETALAGYVGQAGNLSRKAIGAVATLIPVEARQVAWLRDLAGVSPAPRAADPARKADAVLQELRDKGYIA
jgi:rubrerythrin